MIISCSEISEDCWDGYEKKGMKTMFGKRYPNCVKKKKTRKESFEMNKIDAEEHNKAKKKAKIRNLAKGNTNPNEKAAAEKKAGGFPNFLVRNVRNNLLSLIRDLKVQSKERWQPKD